VDIDDISWKQIEDYVFKWYPILNERTFSFAE
jgi:hypothetical protein